MLLDNTRSKVYADFTAGQWTSCGLRITAAAEAGGTSATVPRLRVHSLVLAMLGLYACIRWGSGVQAGWSKSSPPARPWKAHSDASNLAGRARPAASSAAATTSLGSSAL